VEEMIRRDGGSRGPELVPAGKLDVLPGLQAGEIDMAWGFYAWEGIQAELSGQPLHHFYVAESGVPHEYFPLLFTTNTFVAAEPETVTAAVRATARGYTYASQHPAECADLFLRAVPRELLPTHADELVHRSMAWLAPRINGTLDGQPLPHPWGWHNPAQWAAFAAFIRRLADEHRLPTPEPEAESQGYTNDFIPPMREAGHSFHHLT